MRPRRGASWLPSLVFGALLLALWWFFTTFGFVDAYFLPSPQETTARLISGLRSGYLVDALEAALQVAIAGCVVAAMVGIPLGYCIGKSRTFSRMVQPYFAASQAIPAVAIAPLLTIWIGYGPVSIIVLCTIMVIFPSSSLHRWEFAISTLTSSGLLASMVQLWSHPHSHDGDPACRAVNPGGATYGIHTLDYRRRRRRNDHRWQGTWHGSDERAGLRRYQGNVCRDRSPGCQRHDHIPASFRWSREASRQLPDPG